MKDVLWYCIGLVTVAILMGTAIWANLADSRPLEQKQVLLQISPVWKQVTNSIVLPDVTQP
jgi:hypothetical protein